MRRLAIFIALFSAFSYAHAQQPESLSELRARVFGLARVQAVYMDSLLPEGRYPRTFQGDTLVTSDIGWWCSGFYPGVLWTIYDHGKDKGIREMAVRRTRPMKALLDMPTDHDIGFQLMSSYGYWHCFVKNGPEGPDEIAEIERVLQAGAQKLADRFVPSARVIRSWNFGDWNIPVIIDNMMNLDLLMAYGDSTVAQKHALTTMENHFREDGTCVHLVDYADDGSVRGRQTVQGYADDTAWARGQAWALYGFATMARRERISGNVELELTFRRVARKLEQWLLENLPEDGIPYWDFSQTDYKDASAAAIIACGLLKMHGLRGYPDDDPTLAMAERILRTLASPEYLAEPRTNGGFLLKHSVGNLPGRSEIDAPLTYADYYFLEALTLFPN